MTPPTKQTTDNLFIVFRCGGWSITSPSMHRSADRYKNSPANRHHILSFRCAQRGCRQVLEEKP